MIASRQAIYLATIAVQCLHGLVLAHSLSISRGAVILHPDRVIIDLEFSAEDFLHFYPAAAPDAVTADYLHRCLAEFRTELLTSLHLYDMEGHRLPLQIESTEFTPPISAPVEAAAIRQMSAHYRLTSPWSVKGELTLRQTVGAALGGFRCQWVLDVQGPDGRSATSLTLTNGGNAETLSLKWLPGVASPESLEVALLPHREHVQLKATEYGDSLEVEVIIPIPMLDRMAPLDRKNPDYLLSAEFEAVTEKWLPIVTQGLRVSMDDKETAANNVNTEFSDVGGKFGGCTSGDGVAVWTGALQVSMSYPLTPEWTVIELGWTNFNAAIFMVESEVQFLESTARETLTKFTPRCRWTRPASTALNPR